MCCSRVHCRVYDVVFMGWISGLVNSIRTCGPKWVSGLMLVQENLQKKTLGRIWDIYKAEILIFREYPTVLKKNKKKD